MAVENHNANPIIVEPTASPDSGTPPRLLNPSLNTSSSSNSFESSRPQSRGSSATSASESSSPVPSHEPSNLRPQTPSDVEPLPPSATLTPNQSPRSRNLSATPLPKSAEGSPHSNAASWLSSCRPISSRRHWLEHGLGVFTLVASLVGLLFIGVRTYKLAVISTENSTLSGCTDLIQAGFTTLENSTLLCKLAMKHGPLSSPYHLDKRTLRSSLALTSRWMKWTPKRRCGFPYIVCQSLGANTVYRSISTPAIVIITTLALGALMLILAWRNARSMEVFTSPAHSDIQITSGRKTVTGQGILETHKPEDHHDLGQPRKRSRASLDQDSLVKDTVPFQSTNSSSATLTSGRRESPVSLKNRSSGENHKGLIELQINGNTKAFFKMETGELLHLTHWKRQHSNDSDSSSDSDNPNSIERKDVGETVLGASVLAKGRAAKDKWTEELQLDYEKWHDKRSHAKPQAGDCCAGLVTNKLPTGKPQII
ncbi:hypothetical protein HO173_002368 [Letharia columbiana]|uniref:Uncharacterized protein n=1 Tax=Letharia columbiana TaxID=112416 RepID=A0A8H6G3E5_9LECA|nr:uncharacterized protein HO173_002368 [Letharia columbiana]KAF6239822.1 hypothetical protein HO173_002368 [Letharia columbiana]